MSKTISLKEIEAKLDKLPESYRQTVLDFIEFLILKEERKKAAKQVDKK